MDKESLEVLIQRGMSQRQIADELGCCVATVRRWMERHGLRTIAAAARAEQARARRLGMPTIRRTCQRHGLTDFRLEGRGYYRCMACRQERVADRRRQLKVILVEEAGGCCEICGYDSYIGALEFHHRDGAEKRFGLGTRGLTRSLDVLRVEAAKCALLCSNCHAEVEAGVATLS